MGQPPSVSIVVPFRDAEKYLRDAIASIDAQTYRNWELLLVDDGSADASSWFARDLACRFPKKIRYLEHGGHRNKGVAASRNLGVEAARFKYVALLDADDVWLSEKLEQQIAILELHPQVSMVYGRTEYWYSWTGTASGLLKDHVPDLSVETDRIYPPPTLLRLILAGAMTPCPSDVMFRRDRIRALGGFEEMFTGTYGSYEDQAFFAKVFLQTQVFVSSICWDRYRQHSDSVCATAAAAGHELVSEWRYLTWLGEYLRAHGVIDAQIWQSVRALRWRIRHPVLTRWRSRWERVVGARNG